MAKGRKKADETKDIIEELEGKLVKMKEDRDAKCKAAREQLVDMLNVTADKYRTVTGTAEALRVIRFVVGSQTPNDIVEANDLAHDMAEEAAAMAKRAGELDVEEMTDLCKGFYLEDFDVHGPRNKQLDMAYEMMRIDLCRNVGGSAEDMVSFVNRVQEEIDTTNAKLEELKSEKEK